MSPSAGASTPSCTLSHRDHDAVLFDLDGVLTGTASVHANARGALFARLVEDPLLRAISHGACPVPARLDGPRSVMVLAEALPGHVTNRHDVAKGTTARSTRVELR